MVVSMLGWGILNMQVTSFVLPFPVLSDHVGQNGVYLWAIRFTNLALRFSLQCLQLSIRYIPSY